MIDDFSQKYQLPAFRVRQFNQQYYQEAVDAFADISTWPADLRGHLADEVSFSRLLLEREFVSRNKDTTKVLFKRTVDGQRIETVLMRHADGRNTVCVSCMVGCPVNCTFCATGKMGFGGNLSADEIVDQVLYFQRQLKKAGNAVTNVVFMGMGEPMLNLAAVEGAIKVFTDADKLGMSQRRITISTSGYVPQLRKFIDNGFKGRIAISLHAPNQELRAQLMPVAKIYPLDSLIAALDEYTASNNKRVSYEYVMIKNVNDAEQHAKELVKLFCKRLAHVNLIPYNPIAEVSFERSANNQIKRFTDILAKGGVNYTIRVTMGDDVNAACGQLADRENKRNQKKVIKI